MKLKKSALVRAIAILLIVSTLLSAFSVVALETESSEKAANGEDLAQDRKSVV